MPCRRLVLPPVAVELVPNEDSWSELAKQFLRRESFLGQRGNHGRRKKKGGQHDGAEGDAQHRRSAEPRRAESWDTDELQGASPMSSQEVGSATVAAVLLQHRHIVRGVLLARHHDSRPLRNMKVHM